MRNFEPGDTLGVTRNQAERDAEVLAVIGGEMLIEYRMPKGTTSLNIVQQGDANGSYKAVSYRDCPVKWLKAMVENGISWLGYDQRNHHSKKMRDGSYFVSACGQPTPTPLQLLERRYGVGLVRLNISHEVA